MCGNIKKIDSFKGFTLLEILIVVSILLAVSLLITIRVNEQVVLVESTTQEMVSAIRLAREKYDAGDPLAKFRIVFKQGQYYYQVLERGTEMSVDIPIDRSVIISKKMVADEEGENGFVGLNTRPLEIRFSGSTATGTSIMVEGKHSLGKYKITVVPTSSRVHIYKIN